MSQFCGECGRYEESARYLPRQHEQLKEFANEDLLARRRDRAPQIEATLIVVQKKFGYEALELRKRCEAQLSSISRKVGECRGLGKLHSNFVDSPSIAQVYEGRSELRFLELKGLHAIVLADHAHMIESGM